MDRAFYVKCRMEQIKVDRLLVRTTIAIPPYVSTSNVRLDARKTSSMDSKRT